MSRPGIDSEVVWHDVECGAYVADLAAWAELAAAAAGPVLELGAGTGRVALDLARRGIEVVGVDSSSELIAELARRAMAAGLALETVRADTRELDLGREFGAVIAPMQLVHLLGGERGRAAALVAARAHLRAGGVFAAALLADDATVDGRGGGSVLPDVRELDGWVWSSLPLEVAVADGGIEVRRLRQLVSPSGELTERTASVHLDRLGPEAFELEAEALGFERRERIAVPPTADHVGSVICVLGVA
jgi:SAM-dependent methyltransferase